MSSPPALDFPSSDIEDVAMHDGTNTQSMPEAPPLFLASTPSVLGTPLRQPYHQSSPLRGATARRALAMNTPKRTPLFARTDYQKSLD
jgi:DNA replication licensing factor MCM4